MSDQDMVREFMRAFNQHMPDHPTLEGFPLKLRTSLIVEEALEYAHASGVRVELIDPRRPIEPGNLRFELTGEIPDWPEMIDALVDSKYVVEGAALAMGINLEPFFAIVHEANMAKTHGPVRESDGKQLKPEGWEPPDIEGQLRWQIERAEMRAVSKAREERERLEREYAIQQRDDEIADLRNAIQCLNLDLPVDIVNEISKRVEKVIARAMHPNGVVLR